MFGNLNVNIFKSHGFGKRSNLHYYQRNDTFKIQINKYAS